MKGRVVIGFLIAAAVLVSFGTVSAVEETVYYQERFDDDSIGSPVYQTDFAADADGWRGSTYIYMGSVTDSRTRRFGSVFRTTIQGTVDSRWNNYYTYQERSIDIDEPDTYHLYIRASAGFPEGQFDDSIKADRFDVAGRELPIDHRKETHHKLSLDAGSHTFKRITRFVDSDGGRVNGTASIDRFSLLRDSKTRFGDWESDGFPMYTAGGIEGQSLYARSVTARINASPAEDRDPVVAFDVRTFSKPVNWSIKQSGYTIATGTVESDHERRIRRTVSLQTGRFKLDFDSRDTVAIDNVRVLGYDDTSTEGPRLKPDVPALDRAVPQDGYDTLLGGLHGVLDAGLDTATYLALFGLTTGSILFVAGRRADGRGQLLILGAGVLLVSVILFTPLLNTVAWVSTGSADHPSLDEPDLSAAAELYRSDFDAGSMTASDWTQIAGAPSDAYLTTGESGRSMVVLREGAKIETTVSIGGARSPTGILRIDARVHSDVEQAPPDEDALMLQFLAGGSAVIEDATALRAKAGETARTTIERQVELSGSTVTIRLKARDTNGGDDRARAEVTQVSLRGGA